MSAIARVLGYEPGELIGKSLFEFIHPDDVPNVINAFNDGLQIPGCIVSLEFHFQHKDSSWIIQPWEGLFLASVTSPSISKPNTEKPPVHSPRRLLSFTKHTSPGGHDPRRGLCVITAKVICS